MTSATSTRSQHQNKKKDLDIQENANLTMNSYSVILSNGNCMQHAVFMITEKYVLWSKMIKGGIERLCASLVRGIYIVTVP